MTTDEASSAVPADPAAEATRLLEARLEETGAPDPRPLQRENLRTLKTANPDGYRKASVSYREKLLPRIATEGTDPLEAWAEYGRMVTGLTLPGEAVCVLEDGTAVTFAEPVGTDKLALHLPSSGEPALVIAEPIRASAAQKAARALLVERRLRL
ncbi:MAG: hypothetical protein J4G12_03960 [Gemmatimonadetes bacterium]|nr:hypothetical protein [Gemmatimonadota bacterium]